MEQYVSKSALVAEIERLYQEHSSKEYIDEGGIVLCQLEDFLDTLEVKEISDKYDGFFGKELKMIDDEINRLEKLKVKEVDLEAELNKWRHNHFHGRRDKDASGEYLERISQLELAKHFFEFGLRSTITEEDCKLIWTIGDDIPYMAEEEFYKELLKRFKERKIK